MSEIPRKQNDTTPLTGELNKNGVIAPLDNATEVKFFMAKDAGDTPKIDAVAEIVNVSDGRVRYQFTPSDVDEAGIFVAEWQVEYADGTYQTFPNQGYLKINFDEDLSD